MTPKSKAAGGGPAAVGMNSPKGAVNIPIVPQNDLKSQITQAKDFLATLYSPDLPGLLEMRLIPADGQSRTIRRWYRPHQVNLDHLATFNQQGYHIYYGVSLRRRKGGSKSDVSWITALWADLDDKNFQGGKEEALATARSFDLPPSIILDSGHGIHAYWLLRKPVATNGEEDIKGVEEVLRGLAAWLHGDRSVADVARVMRLPGFLNVKDPEHPVLCHILALDTDRRYDLADFQGYRSERKESTDAVFARKQERGRLPIWATQFLALGAVEGERDNLAFATACQLRDAGYGREEAVDLIAQALARSNPDRDPVRWAEEKVKSAWKQPPREPLPASRDFSRKKQQEQPQREIEEPEALDLALENVQDLTGTEREQAMRELFQTLAEMDPFTRSLHRDAVCKALSISKGDFERLVKVVAETPPENVLYTEHEGRFCRIRHSPEGDILIPLCDFAPYIIEEVAIDDGTQDIRRVLILDGRYADGTPLGRAEVSAEEFPRMDWVIKNWGVKANIRAGLGTKDHLRAAIQTLSRQQGITHCRVYAHTGWRVLDGKRVYLHNDGAVGHDGAIEVALEPEKLNHYRFPPAPTDEKTAFAVSLSFLDVARRTVTWPLWAALYLAPLCPVLPPRFALWLYGESNSMKSSLAAVAMQHYGDWALDARDFVQWGDTAFFLEIAAHAAKDAPLVIDDFRPNPDYYAQRRMNQVAERIVRAAGNLTGRGRGQWGKRIGPRDPFSVRGMIIATGESLPDFATSAHARLFPVRFVRGRTVDLNLLSQAQRPEAGQLYREAMTGYLLWLSRHWEEISATVTDHFPRYRARVLRDNKHMLPRLAEAVVRLYIALEVALEYGEETGAIGHSTTQRLLAEAWETLINTAKDQDIQVRTHKPVVQYLTLLENLLASGQVYLQGDEGRDVAPEPKARMIGWADDEYWYLFPEVTYAAVSRLARESGTGLLVNEQELRKRLKDVGVSEPDAGRLTTRKKRDQKVHYVLKLSRAEIEKLLEDTG